MQLGEIARVGAQPLHLLRYPRGDMRVGVADVWDVVVGVEEAAALGIDQGAALPRTICTGSL